MDCIGPHVVRCLSILEIDVSLTKPFTVIAESVLRFLCLCFVNDYLCCSLSHFDGRLLAF